MFSEESSFKVRPIHVRKRVWRKKGTRFLNSDLAPTFASDSTLLSVWGRFSKEGQTDLVRIYGSLNQQKYMKMLRCDVLPFAYSNHGGLCNFVFHLDGCVAYRTKSIKLYLDE